jgi:hypothetical protein
MQGNKQTAISKDYYYILLLSIQAEKRNIFLS